jgi:hypothetical protein
VPIDPVPVVQCQESGTSLSVPGIPITYFIYDAASASHDACNLPQTCTSLEIASNC